MSQLDDLRVGDEVRVEFSLRGREWRSPKGETKYFNSLDVWRIEPAVPRDAPKPSSRSSGGNAQRTSADSDPDADIPFATCTAHDN